MGLEKIFRGSLKIKKINREIVNEIILSNLTYTAKIGVIIFIETLVLRLTRMGR